MSQVSRGRIAVLAVLVLVLVMTGCSGRTTEKPAAEDAKFGGQVSIPIYKDPDLLNPILRGDVSTLKVNYALFDFLAAADPNTLDSVPELATSWEWSGDGKTLTVHLRKDAYWHDGKPITAEDIKFTYEKIMDKNTNTDFRVKMTDLESVETVDEKTVAFHLKRPNYAFESCLQIQPIPKHAFEGVTDINTAPFNQNPIGSGPFRLKEFKRGQYVVVEANDKYWGGRPYLDRIVFKVIPDLNVQLAQLKTGELDVVDMLEPVQLKALESEKGRINIYRVVHANYMGFFYKWTAYPFSDIRVRKAINHAIDRKAIIENVLLGEAVLANTPFPPAFTWAHFNDVKSYDYDPEKAKQLLAEAGWKDTNGDGILDKDGKPFQLTMYTDNLSPTRKQIAALGQQYLKAIGIDVKLEYREWTDFLENVEWKLGDKQITFFYNAFNPPYDPDSVSVRWYSGTNPRSNHTGYGRPEVDRLFDEARATKDKEQRKQLYQQIQEIIAEDAPMVLVYYPVELTAVSNRIKNIIPSPMRIFHNMEQWYLEK